MRFVRYTMTFCLLLLALAVSAKGSTKQIVYMFGFSASFNDSIVYFTPVQQVEAYIANDRTHFLLNRDQYSYQLRNFFDNRGQLNRTCVTVFSTDKAKAEKKYAKMKEKYTNKLKNRFEVTYLTDDDFKFTTVNPDDGVEFVNPHKAEVNAAKENAKMAKDTRMGHGGRPDMKPAGKQGE